MGELISKLGIDWKLLVANTITFFIVLWVLRKFAYRPIMNVLERRQQTISDGLQAAKQSGEELTAMQQEKQVVLKAAKVEAQAIISAAKEQGETVKQKLAEQATSESTATLERTKELLDRERQAMVRQAKVELADLVVTATTKVLDQTLDAKTRTHLSDRAIAAVKDMQRS